MNRTIAFVLVVLLITLTACGGGEDPVQQTQTAVAQTQVAIEQTQVAISLGSTQTAQAQQQEILSTQIAATQTAEILAITADALAIAATQTRAASPYITRNDDWMPEVREFNGVEMVLVPVGCFTMGSTDEQIDTALAQCIASAIDCRRSVFENESPTTEICFDEPFWIDRYEVTNAQFARFNGVAEHESYFEGDNLPRENITWLESRDFCEERGARLPTEAEWEYAARGPDGLIYPWGNTFDGTRANFCDTNCEYDWKDTNSDDGYQYTAPVGSYAGGVSWVGAYDMSGNVYEWVNTSAEYGFPYPYNAGDGRESDSDNNSMHGRRGGYWAFSETSMRAAGRAGSNDAAPPDGFRCARSYSSDS